MPFGYAVSTLLSLVAVGVGVGGMLGRTASVQVEWLIPVGGLDLNLDSLGGFFLALVGLIGVASSIAGASAGGAERRGTLAYLSFLVSMALVPVAANVLTFLLAWELMALASYVLVVGHPASRESVRAGWVYAVMTHAGFACLLAGMLLMSAWTGSLRFADWHLAGAGLTPSARSLVFGLLALGFAGKAGVIPLHVWLPLAHPAAPSHVSALMSGVMIKLGVYGLLRVAFDWLGGGPMWWGVLVLLAGTGSAVIGVLYALVEHDLKRLLAFHSIENVGIILMGLGAGLMFHEAGLPRLAVLGLAAALYHTLNHAVFKALLFLGAGAVVHATGTRNMELMGGLIKRMPWTAACFLVGSAAIAALPPLNGFVSEWLTFQALLQTVRLPHPELNLVFVAGVAGLALTGGLAAACFVKAFGISFLALPRSDAAARAHEAPIAMRAAMVILAFACLALGLGPTVVAPVLASVAAPLVGGAGTWWTTDWFTISIAGDFANLSMPALAAALVAGLLLPIVTVAVLGVGRRGRVTETWACGRLLQTARMEYTATAFSSPFKRVFDFFYRPEKQLDIAFHPQSRFFVQRIEYENPTRSVFDDWLYRPALVVLRTAARRARAIQSGNANLYLMYILAALLALLVLA